MRAAWVGRPRSGSCTRARPSGRASAPSHGQHPSGPSSTTDTLAQNLPGLIGTGHTLPRFGDAVANLPVLQTSVSEQLLGDRCAPHLLVSLPTAYETQSGSAGEAISDQPHDVAPDRLEWVPVLDRLVVSSTSGGIPCSLGTTLVDRGGPGEELQLGYARPADPASE